MNAGSYCDVPRPAAAAADNGGVSGDVASIMMIHNTNKREPGVDFSNNSMVNSKRLRTQDPLQCAPTLPASVQPNPYLRPSATMHASATTHHPLMSPSASSSSNPKTTLADDKLVAWWKQPATQAQFQTSSSSRALHEVSCFVCCQTFASNIVPPPSTTPYPGKKAANVSLLVYFSTNGGAQQHHHHNNNDRIAPAAAVVARPPPPPPPPPPPHQHNNRCAFCERRVCANCLLECQHCSHWFCVFCSHTCLLTADTLVLCLDCVNQQRQQQQQQQQHHIVAAAAGGGGSGGGSSAGDSMEVDL